MKKIILIISILATSIVAQAQDAKSKSISLSFNVNDYINSYVIPKVEEWQKQGRYESNVDYLQRVNEQTRSSMLEQLTAEAIAAFKKKIAQGIDWNSSLKIAGYDANNATFLMRSDIFGDFTLLVPQAKAESFETNFVSIRKLNPDFYFTADAVHLDKLTFVTSSGEQFNYDSHNPKPFVPNINSYNFGDIVIVVPHDDGRPQPPIINPFASNTASDVDTEIPKTKKQNPHTYALVIGNEDYSKATSNPEKNVLFAAGDAKIFKEYCTQTLGIPENNIKLLINATGNNMFDGIDWLAGKSELEKGKAELIFYYAGHGLPDEKTNVTCLIPADLNGKNLARAVKITDLYAQLNKYPAERTTIFLDACFSGGARGQELVEGRATLISPKISVPVGNIVVFTACSKNEIAGAYKEKRHGYFTYFLLKKLQETKGDIDYDSLFTYIFDNVRETSDNDKRQTPEILAAPKLITTWQTWKLIK
jgi:hypothetical protein